MARRILIGIVAKVGPPILALCKFRVAARLHSRARRADAVESITCGYFECKARRAPHPLPEPPLTTELFGPA